MDYVRVKSPLSRYSAKFHRPTNTILLIGGARKIMTLQMWNIVRMTFNNVIA